MPHQKTKSQIGRGSKNKGKVGEREVVALLREYGYAAQRGQQFAGGPGSPDVVHNMRVSDYCAIHIEVKRSEQLALWAALAQAEADTTPGDIPVVFHRKNHTDWVVILEASDFLAIMKRTKK